jgi:hypothetical protein
MDDMTTKIKSMPTKYAIYNDGESPIYGENTITIELDDEAGGPFFKLSSNNDVEFRVDLDELKELTTVAERMEAEYNLATQEEPDPKSDWGPR